MDRCEHSGLPAVARQEAQRRVWDLVYAALKKQFGKKDALRIWRMVRDEKMLVRCANVMLSADTTLDVLKALRE